MANAFKLLGCAARLGARVAAKGCKLLIHFHGCGGCGIDSNPFNNMQGGYVRYAETNGVVLMHPCIQGIFHKAPNSVSKSFPNALEIARACWGGHGQLSADYALQSGPHMRSVWNMARAIAGSTYKTKADCATACS